MAGKTRIDDDRALSVDQPTAADLSDSILQPGAIASPDRNKLEELNLEGGVMPSKGVKYNGVQGIRRIEY